MKIWIIDTETTGLPEQPCFGIYYKYDILKYYNSSRMIQLGILEFDLIDGKYEQTNSYEFIHKGEFKIHNEKFHGITNKIVNNNGISIVKIADELKDKFKDVDLMVAHNMNFDRNIIASEFYRANLIDILGDFLNIPVYCTSVGTRDLVRLKNKYKGKGYKQPKLIELYNWSFNSNPQNIDNMHNAMIDCEILAKCFFSLVQKNLFTVKKR